MQSKLPVRIQERQTNPDHRKCYCAQLLKIMLDAPIDSHHKFGVKKGLSSKQKKCQSKSMQTQLLGICMECENEQHKEIKNLLVSINCILEHILRILQNKKEDLYNKLQDGVLVPNKKPKSHHKNTIENLNKQISELGKTLTWPDISRLYYGQPTLLKHYMQKIPYELSSTYGNLATCQSRANRLCSRRFSCSDIKYYQPMGTAAADLRRFGITIYSYPVFVSLGQGDLNIKDDSDDDMKVIHSTIETPEFSSTLFNP